MGYVAQSASTGRVRHAQCTAAASTPKENAEKKKKVREIVLHPPQQYGFV
jgi:hypothetical protein